MTKSESQKEIQKITKQIIRGYQPEKIILFGSFAVNQTKPESDVDLVVVKKTKKKFGSRLFEVAKLVQSKMGTDILVYTPKEWQKGLNADYYFFKEIEKKGKLLYEKGK